MQNSPAIRLYFKLSSWMFGSQYLDQCANLINQSSLQRLISSPNIATEGRFVSLQFISSLSLDILNELNVCAFTERLQVFLTFGVEFLEG